MFDYQTNQTPIQQIGYNGVWLIFGLVLFNSKLPQVQIAQMLLNITCEVYSRQLIFGKKIIACPAADWQATGGKKLFSTYNALSFRCLFCFIFLRSSTMSWPLKAKRNAWSIVEEKDFLLLCSAQLSEKNLWANWPPSFHFWSPEQVF